VVQPLEDAGQTVVDGAGHVVDGAQAGAEKVGDVFSDAWPDNWP
jgi:hypothetical protein